MIKNLLFFTAITLFLNLNAQVSDVVTTGADFTNDVFYSLENGEISAEPRTEWDIAFNMTLQGSSILTNGGNGVELYVYPNGGAEEWDNFETSGYEDWGVKYNSESTWSTGAFDQEADGFNVGWGTYNPVTHVVTGDVLFLVKLADGTFKKVLIESLNEGTFTYMYANIDGSDQVTSTIAKGDYPNKNFAYVSLSSNEVIDREPMNSSWDLQFTKYITNVGIFYPVSGVLNNMGVKVLQVENTPTADAQFIGETFSESISEIGFDWKEFNMEIFQYIIEDNLTYFVQDVNGGIWKLIFTGFGGSTNGEYEFTKELVGVVGIDEVQNLTGLEIFPNPTQGMVNVVYHTTDAEITNLRVLDLTGKVILSENLKNTNQGLNQEFVDLNGIQAGIYLLELNKNGNSVFQKLIIE